MWVNAKDVNSVTELTDLLIAAGCIPPVIPIQRWQGTSVLDGGLIDNAAIEAWEHQHGKQGQTLILVTRRYRHLTKSDHRMYVQPSRPVPASKLDFTDPEQIEAAFALGKHDGERFWKQIQQGVNIKNAAPTDNLR